jgi:hypothetical protein
MSAESIVTQSTDESQTPQTIELLTWLVTPVQSSDFGHTVQLVVQLPDATRTHVWVTGETARLLHLVTGARLVRFSLTGTQEQPKLRDIVLPGGEPAFCFNQEGDVL